MRIAVAADENTGVAGVVADQLRARGHEPLLHGALNPDERDDWAWASEAAAPMSPRAAPTRPSSRAGPAPEPRSQRTRSPASAPPCAETPRPRPAPASGTTPTSSPSHSAPPPRRCLPRSSTPGSAPSRPSDDDDRANVAHLGEIGSSGLATLRRRRLGEADVRRGRWRRGRGRAVTNTHDRRAKLERSAPYYEAGVPNVNAAGWGGGERSARRVHSLSDKAPRWRQIRCG